MRTVGVRLEADTSRYDRGMDGASQKAKKVKDDLDKIGSSKGLSGVNDQAKELGVGLKGVGDQGRAAFEEAAKHAATLDKQIRDVESDLRSLAKGFANTRSPELIKAMKEQQGLLNDLKSVRKYMPDPAEVASAGLSLGRRLGDGITKAVPPQLSSAVVAGGIAAAPLLSAALVGATSGSVGFSVITSGIMLAVDDPKIKAKAKDLGEDLSFYLRRSARDFGPAVTDSISKVRGIVQDLEGDLERAFSSGASYLDPFLDNVEPAIDSIVAGIADIMEQAGPTLAVISDGIGDIGVQIGGFLQMVADNSDAGAMALSDLFDIIEFGLSQLTTTIDILAKMYEFSMGWTQIFRDNEKAVDDFGNAADKSQGSADVLGKSVEESGNKAKQAKTKFEDFAQVLQDVVGDNISAAEAQIQYRAAVDSATKAVDKSVKVTDDEATALLGLARQSNSTTAALDKQGQTVDQARRLHQKQREELIRVAERMGYTRKQARDLANQYLATPKAVATSFGVPGLKQSDKDIRTYHRNLDRITRQIKTNVDVKGDDVAYRKLRKLLIAQQAASKGISVSAASSAFRKQEAPAFARGGQIDGPGAGTSDDIPIWASRGEYMLRADAVRKIGKPVLDFINRNGQLPQFAAGGMVMPFRVNAAVTKVISMQEALAKVIPAVPSGGRTSDWIVRVARSWFPGIDVLSKDRPGSRTLSGNVSYHARGRAVDFEPSKELAARWYGSYKSRTKELISPYQQYNIHNGRSHTYTGAVWNQHNFAGGNAHDHIAMANGGVIGEPVVGYGLSSGRSYSFAENGPETVTPGVLQPAPPTVNVNVAGADSQAVVAALATLIQVTAQQGPMVANAIVNGRARALQQARAAG